MKNLIRKILKESTTPKADFYRKVAKSIADKFVRLDHDNFTYHMPYTGPIKMICLSNDSCYRSTAWADDENSFPPHIDLFLDKQFGVKDLPDGVLRSIDNLIKKYVKERLELEISH